MKIETHWKLTIHVRISSNKGQVIDIDISSCYFKEKIEICIHYNVYSGSGKQDFQMEKMKNFQNMFVGYFLFVYLFVGYLMG